MLVTGKYLRQRKNDIVLVRHGVDVGLDLDLQPCPWPYELRPWPWELWP